MKFYIVNNEARAQHIEDDMDRSIPGSFRKTTASYTEIDNSGAKTNPVCEIDTAASNFTTFKASFIAEFGKYPEEKSSQYFNTDYINLVRYMLNPEGNHFTIPVKSENAQKLFEIFGKTLSTASKFENTDLYILDLNFTDGEMSNSEKLQLKQYVAYIDSQFGSSLNLTAMGPDLASLYQFALENQPAQPIVETPSVSPAPTPSPSPTAHTGESAPISLDRGIDLITEGVTRNPASAPTSTPVTWTSVFTGDDSDINTIPSALFDPWAVATGFNNALKGNKPADRDIFQDNILHSGNGSEVELWVLEVIKNELDEGISYIATPGSDYALYFDGAGEKDTDIFENSEAGTASFYIDYAIKFFKTSVAVAEFSFNSTSAGNLTVKAYVNSNPNSGGAIFLEITNSAGVITRYIRHSNDAQFHKLNGSSADALPQDLLTDLTQIQSVITNAITTNPPKQIRPDIYLETFGN